MNFGKTIREAREQRGWSQSELAQLAGTNQSTVDRIERGLTTHSKHMNNLLEVLEVTRASTLSPPAIDPVLVATWQRLGPKGRKKLLQIALIIAED